MKIFRLSLGLILYVALSANYASAHDYCLRNNALGTVYIYALHKSNGHKTVTPIGKIKSGHRLSGISKSSFPLLASNCSSAPLTCSDSRENHVIQKAGCYIIANFSGLYATKLACGAC